MNIVMIVPGLAQGGYCENCLRDAALLSAFGKLGHEVTVVPLYLPFDANMKDGNCGPIFFGGINVFLQEKSAFFRKTPEWLDRLFDNPRILRWVSGRFSMVDARLLGSTTVSMLKGKDGRQTKELDRLVRWLAAASEKPEIVCLSNALLAGLAGPIKDAVQMPVICMLQGEDIFLDALMVPYNQQAWELLTHQADHIDGFVAVSRNFADLMRRRLSIRQEKIHIVYAGTARFNFEKTAEEMISVFRLAARNFKGLKNA